MINNSKKHTTKVYHPKVETRKKIKNKKYHQSKLVLQGRINEREREREQSPFLEENVRQITKLYKRR